MRRALPDAAAAVGIALLAASAWLFAPRERGGAPTLPAVRVVLVDVSRSAVMRRSNWRAFVEGEIEREKREAEAAGEDAVVVLFGATVRRVQDLGALEDIVRSWYRRPPGEGFTDLAGALRVAGELAAEPGRAGARVVLIGDGTYTGADPRSDLDALARAGVAVDRVDLPPPDRTETACGGLVLPREVEVGAPIAVDCDVFHAPGDAEPPSRLQIPILHEFASGHWTTTLDLEVPPGIGLDPDGYLRWRLRTSVGAAEPGWNRIAVGGSAGVVRAAGAATVGITLPGPDHPWPPTLWAFPVDEAPGLDVVLLRLNEVPRRLADLDALVTVDVPLDRLPLEVLGSYVRGGGGWLAVIDRATLRSFESEPTDLLPLRPVRDLPPRDVTFLVDRSGSMSGERSDAVRRAVLELIDATPPSDALFLRSFAARLGDPIPLLPRSGARTARERNEAKRRVDDALLAGSDIGGATAMLGALESIARERERSPDDGLVFLLTDGVENYDPDPVANAPRVGERLAASRTRLVAIAASDAAQHATLQTLVGPSETVHPADSIRSFSGSLFRRELARGRMRDEGTVRIVPGAALLASERFGSDVLRAQLESLAEPWPGARRYVRAVPAGEASVLWTATNGDPLLAFHRVGLGTTAVCAFAVSPDGMMQRDEERDALRRLLLPLLRALARGLVEPRPSARVEGGRLVVEGLPSDAPAVLEARIFAASAEPEEPPRVVLTLAPPSEGDPRLAREAAWPAALGGGFLALFESPAALDPDGLGTAAVPRLELRASSGGTSFEPIDLPLVLPGEPESVLPRPRLPAIPSPRADVTRPSAPSPHPSAPWVLLSGMVLLAGAGAGGSFSRRAR